jgi:hypothetical protein
VHALAVLSTWMKTGVSSVAATIAIEPKAVVMQQPGSPCGSVAGVEPAGQVTVVPWKYSQSITGVVAVTET